MIEAETCRGITLSPSSIALLGGACRVNFPATAFTGALDACRRARPGSDPPHRRC